MKKSLLLLSLFLGYSASSQSIYMPTLPASSITYQISLKSDTVPQSTQGPWDFSSETTSGLDSISYEPIVNSAFASLYPNATHVKYEGSDQFFLGFETDKFTFHGERTVITTSFPTPLIVMPYPFTVGAVHAHSKPNIPFTCNGCPPSMFRSDLVNAQALASGTIIMPDNTVHNNAVLVFNTRTFNDGQTGSAKCTQILKQYQWWVSGYPFPVVQSIEYTANQNCPPNIDFRQSKFLIGNPSVGLDENNSDQISIYPNPANDILYLNIASEDFNANYIIMDATGRIVSNGIISSDTKTLNVANLAKGMYTISLLDDIKTVLKFIKQ
jgi:hypothetical protein